MSQLRSAARLTVATASLCPHIRLQLRKQCFALQRSRSQTFLLPQMITLRFSSTQRGPRDTRANKYDFTKGQAPQTKAPRLAFRADWSSIKRGAADSPSQVRVGLVIIGIIITIGFCIIGKEMYFRFFIFNDLPRKVAKPLRKALYFTNVKWDPPMAMKHYDEALNAAQEAGLHPLSDKVLGIELQIAKVTEEKLGGYEAAIDLYEHMVGRIAAFLQTRGELHYETGHRSRLLVALVRVQVKLGRLYAMPFIGRHEEAEGVFSQAVTTILREKQRRKNTPILENEGSFFEDAEEVGGAIESLADTYRDRKKWHFAAPLYLQAITLCDSPCHRVILMNNLADSLIQQPKPDVPAGLALPTPHQQAALWIERAISVADDVPENERTEECLTGCVAAKANLAGLAEKAGDLKQARTLFNEAVKMAKDGGFEQGEQFASDGRRRVTSTIKEIERQKTA